MNAMTFSAKYGGLGIINPSKISDRKYRTSRILVEEGSQHFKNQHSIYDVKQKKLKEIKNGIKCENFKQYQGTLSKIKQTLENGRL